MGENFSDRYPVIYKYGKFKRALRLWKEDKFLQAYREIAGSFHIDSIKKHFNPKYDPHKFKTILFSKENLKLDDKKPLPQESFADKGYEKFLEDVYILVMVNEH